MTKLYERLQDLPLLAANKLISIRPHHNLPLYIYNYTQRAQFMPMDQWTPALMDCRGLILDEAGYIVGRGFSKFWNYEQVLDKIPTNEGSVIWEKLDGYLGIVCNYEGHRIVSTRGSFESSMAIFASAYLDLYYPRFSVPEGLTYLFEIIYPEGRIVVDYKGRQELVLLAILDQDGKDRWDLFEAEKRFQKAQRYFDVDLDKLDLDDRFWGQEGLVVSWESGFRAKVELQEYKRQRQSGPVCFQVADGDF